MGNDGLLQISKQLKQDRDKVKTAERRAYPNYPTVDRVRDVFDNYIPFIMLFKTAAKDSSVSLNLTFYDAGAPATGGGATQVTPCSYCRCSVCEYFKGQSSITTTRPYLAGTVNVFVDEVQTTNFTEVNPAAGTITISNILIYSSSNITVCYAYEKECEEPTCVCDCGITDTFMRTAGEYVDEDGQHFGGWGTSDSGIVWKDQNLIGLEYGMSVHDGVGELRAYMDINENWAWAWLGWNTYVEPTFSSTFDFKLSGSWIFDYAGGPIEFGFGFGTCHGSLRYSYNPPDITKPWTLLIGHHGDPGSGPYHLYIENLSLFLSLDTWYTMRFSRENGYLRCRYWPRGESEPNVWLLELDVSTRLWNDFDTPDWHIGNFSSFIGPDAVLQLDNISITGIDRCSENRFDNFNRIVDGAWGTSSYGISWVLDSPLNVQISVDDSRGKAVFPQNTTGLAPFKPLYMTSGPWASTNTFTMTTRFNLALSAEILLYGISVENTVSSDFIEVWVIPRTGMIGIQNIVGILNEYDDVSFSFSDGVYLLKWEVTHTNTRAKVWADGTIEPLSWNVTIPSTFFPPNRLNVTPQGRFHTTGGSAILAIDYIDFDYAGKPCAGTLNCT